MSPVAMVAIVVIVIVVVVVVVVIGIVIGIVIAIVMFIVTVYVILVLFLAPSSFLVSSPFLLFLRKTNGQALPASSTPPL